MLNAKTLPGVRIIKIAVVAVIIILAAALSFASVHWIRAALAKRATDPSTVTRPVQTRSSLDIQRITLRATGFEPAEVTRPAGRFLLAINDRSGQPDTRFILTRSGERLKEVRVRDTPRKHEWRELVNLPPGRYVLSDSENPERVCHILLTR
jgi:hypothetical protein